MRKESVFSRIVKGMLNQPQRINFDHPGDNEIRLANRQAKKHNQTPEVGWLALLVARAIRSLEEGEKLDGGTGKQARRSKPDDFKDMY